MIAIGVTLTGCERDKPPASPHVRFVDSTAATTDPDQPPTASLSDETRYVLGGFTRGLVFDRENVQVPRDGRLHLSARLGGPLAGARRVVLSPRIRTGFEWVALPQQLVRVEPSGDRGVVPIRLDLSPRSAGSSVRVHVIGHVPPDGATTAHQTPVIEIPSAANLEFGMGVLEPAWTEGAVEFSVQACHSGKCRRLFSETVDPGKPTGRGWLDRRLSLAGDTGRKLTFRFETRALRSAPDSFSLPLWSNPTLYAPKIPAPGDVNFILLSIDTLRADHLTSYGCAHNTAPFIDEKLAAEGTLFENVVAAATTTGPSHMTMFTSLQPSAHGLTEKNWLPDPPPLVLAEVLRAHGFETGAVTEDGPLHAGWGFARGFNSYAENTSPNVMLPEGHIGSTFEKARTWLARHRNKRFFLFLHTFQVHFPYTPPAAYGDLFEPDDAARARQRIPPEYDPVLYDREIRYVDDRLREFLRGLEDEGLTANTVLILTSDHGEEFLEHGFLGHGPHLHPEVLHVPLIFWGPGVASGRRIQEPVAHVDFMPTILTLAGLPVPRVAMGRSLAEVLRQGAALDELPSDPLYSEAWYETAMDERGLRHGVLQPTLSVRLGDRKLVRYRTESGHGFRYFELATDPEEGDDLYATRRGEVGDLVQLLDRYEERCRELRSLATKQRALLPPSFTVGATIDPAVEEKLRMLGYVD